MGKNAPIIADIFMKYLGVHEVPGPDANPEILKFFQDTTYRTKSDETAWCSASACFVVDEARQTHPEIDPSPHSAAAVSWAHWGEEVPDGEQDRGDMALFEWYNSEGYVIGHHIAVYLGEDDDHPGMVQVVGGNQTKKGFPDEVNVKYEPLDNVINFRRPKNYNG